MTREQWLNKAVDLARPLFTRAGYPLPPVVGVSVGWPTKRPFASKGGSRSIGQCFAKGCSTGKRPEIFISPVLSNSTRVLDVLVHELVHAAQDCATGHGAAFKRLAVAVGLTGPMTATTASGELYGVLLGWVNKLGPYPHPSLDVVQLLKQQPKDGTRQLKIECPACGYIVRTSAKWIAVGLPTCCCGGEFEEAAR